MTANQPTLVPWVWKAAEGAAKARGCTQEEAYNLAIRIFGVHNAPFLPVPPPTSHTKEQ